MTVADYSLVNERLCRLLTQYRESPNFQFIISTYLRQLEIIYQTMCDFPEDFDIDTAVADQLTLVGNRLGWPRCHCVCLTQPVAGFRCPDDDSGYELAGFCNDNSTWLACGSIGTGQICINDDELYRKFLKARTYQINRLYDIQNLNAAVQVLFGPQAFVADYGDGEVVIAPRRLLTADERAVLQLYPRVLPVAIGIQVYFDFGITDISGFGEGWGGFCEHEVVGSSKLLSDALIAVPFYNFTSLDVSGNNNNVTIGGAVEYAPGYDGELGGSISFPGGNDTLDRATFGAITLGAEVTLVVRVKVTSATTGASSFFRLDAGPSDRISMGNEMDPLDFRLVYIENGNPHILSTPNFFVLDEWTYLTCTIDATGLMTSYKNAQQISSFQAPTGIFQGVYSSGILGGGLGSTTFNGCVDNFIVFDRVLTQEEIQLVNDAGVRTLASSNWLCKEDVHPYDCP